jgi:phosphoinositide-3-kinase, regulatory subunit 4
MVKSHGICNDYRKNKAFPEYFISFLHQYLYSITDGSVGNRSTAPPASERITEGDERLSRIYHDFDKIAFFLGFFSDGADSPQQVNGTDVGKKVSGKMFPVQIDIPNYSRVRKPQQSEPISSKDGALIFLSLIMSTMRNTSRPQSRVEACDTVLALSERISDEAKLDRVLPYLVTLLSDEIPVVRVSALRTITQLVTHFLISLTIAFKCENINPRQCVRVLRIRASKNEQISI